MRTTEEREAILAEKLLKNADKVLALIDDAFIVRERGHEPREMPRFRPEEISLGPVLGVGGFGVVNEVKNITLDPSFGAAAAAACTGAGTGDDDNEASGGNDCNTTADKKPTPASGEREGGKENGKKDEGIGEENTSVHSNTSADTNENRNFEDNNNQDSGHFHYEISKARRVMSKRCMKNAVTARYAIKRLHTGDLSKLERARGMVDLAVEAKYLSVVWHPNIIKMRGMGAGPLVSPDFFIILDRLFGTLDQRINHWYRQNKKFKGKFLGIGKKRRDLHNLMVERMTVAYDLAAAFFYLHENRLVYRDIKPENIGFDVRGDVKVFDFGLCKSLSPEMKARDGAYGYRLTGRAGSLPYMAPEVIKMETYDTKCDVYSFAILLWEILNLQQSFKGMSPSQFVEEVVIKKTRLPVPTTIPPLTRLMIPEAWDDDPRKRPDMKRCAILIRGDLNDMTSDVTILHRTKHMNHRSDHSVRGEALEMGGPPATKNAHLELLSSEDEDDDETS